MVEVVTSDAVRELGAADGAKDRRDISIALYSDIYTVHKLYIMHV